MSEPQPRFGSGSASGSRDSALMTAGGAGALAGVGLGAAAAHPGWSRRARRIDAVAGKVRAHGNYWADWPQTKEKGLRLRAEADKAGRVLGAWTRRSRTATGMEAQLLQQRLKRMRADLPKRYEVSRELLAEAAASRAEHERWGAKGASLSRAARRVRLGRAGVAVAGAGALAGGVGLMVAGERSRSRGAAAQAEGRLAADRARFDAAVVDRRTARQLRPRSPEGSRSFVQGDDLRFRPVPSARQRAFDEWVGA